MKFKLNIHIQAGLIWLIYSALGKVVFFWGTIQSLALVGYFLVAGYASIFGLVFFYIFSHPKFFKFAREIERKQKQQEMELVEILLHTGKAITTLIGGGVGGPVAAAALVRLFYARSRYRYLIVLIICLVHGIGWLTLTRSGVKIFL